MAGALLVTALAKPSTALAHATLVRSDPPDPCAVPKTSRSLETDPSCNQVAIIGASPTVVRLQFSEPVQPVAGGISVRGPAGQAAGRGAARVDGPTLTLDVDAAQIGTYLVVWRVVSSDTHPARGSFAFSVGQPSADNAPQAAELGAISLAGLALQVGARWLHFIGYALGFGVIVTRAFLWRTAGATQPFARLVDVGVTALLLAEPLALLAQSASLGLDQTLEVDALTDILSSSFGRVLGLRLAAAVLLWVVVGSAAYAPVWAPRSVVALGVALAVVDGQAAHAATVRPEWLGLGINAVHEVAMGVWLGGLVALLATWRSGVMARARPGFSRVASGALVLLVVSGSAMAAEHLASAVDLVMSPYGRALLVKLVVLIVALALAARAHRATGHRAARARRAEAAALVAILALAGLLVSLPPPI